MDKLLTIIIPSYNVERYLDTVLKTYILPDLFPMFEVLIVNDGSTDRTAEIAETYCEQYPECFHLITKENGGHGSTINTGIQRASGKYIRVIDGDDWVDTQCLKRFLEKLQRIDADVVISPYNEVNDEGALLKNRPLPPDVTENKTLRAEEQLDALRVLYAMHSSTFRTDILRRIPPISEHCFYVDQELKFFPMKEMKTVAFVNECVYQYRLGTQGQSVSLNSLKKNRAQHAHVILRVLDEIRTWEDVPYLPIVKNTMIHLTHLQLELYAMMPPSRETYRDIQDFVSDVKKKAPWLLPQLHYWKDKAMQIRSPLVYYVVEYFTHLRMKK